MRKSFIFSVFFLFALGVFAGPAAPAKYTVTSPDKATQLEVGTAGDGRLSFRVTWSGRHITDWSPLGLVINGITAGEHTVVVQESQTTHHERFAWRLGENDTVVNDYHQMDLTCRSASFPFHLIARVFNGSVAFRYAFAVQKGSIREEKTSIVLAAPYSIYQYHHESVFTPSAIDTFTTPCDLPATITDGHTYISIGEAGNDNYTKAELTRGAAPHSLQYSFVRDSAVKTIGAFQTPWRTISMARSAIGLHAFSDLYLRLNPAPSGGIPAWIRPGKLIRAQLTTQSGMECIDFAVKERLQYILFDWHWYGPDHRADAHPGQPIAAIDLPAVIQYGKARGIGIILYVDYLDMRNHIDSLLPLYKAWGVSGLKFGFVDGFTQNGLQWLVSAIKKVSEAGFILDIHDNYKPTGLSRTYPALLTQEGIRGDENSPDAFHTTVLPFTRCLAGPADFTFCYPNAFNSYAKNIRVSKAQQLALTVIYFSPLQSMFWYGKPDEYTDEQDIEFFSYVPTVWDESYYLAGDIGQGISVARRHGADWFIGNAAGPADWKDSIRLDFLAKGRGYTATIDQDDGKGGIYKKFVPVRKNDILPIDLKAASGEAIIIRPDMEVAAFVHPGLLQSREDLERMKKAVAAHEQPVYSGYEIFQQNPESHNSYKMKGPMASVGRNPTVGQGTYDEDANAAYQNALNWAITGDQAYADKAKEIVNAWSDTLRSITGRDAVLMAGLGPFKMVNAAEILRYTNAGWSAADIDRTERHFKQVIYPVLKDFAPFANGNWDAAAMKTVMAIAVFCNDRELFERALRYYVDGGGNGCLTHYVINEEGQIQESGRDQQHTQLGIGLLGDCSEIAWHQGLDLYAYANNRLLRGFEYTARYNLGNDVAFTPDLDRTGKYAHAVISTQGRGNLRSVYEQVYNHYVNRMGLSAPFAAAAAAKIRPEGPGKPGADHPGYGTLFYSRPVGGKVVKGIPAAPGGLIAKARGDVISLSWVGSVGADGYDVRRSDRPGGPFVVVSGKVRETEYIDRQVKAGKLYYYTVSADNRSGKSADAYEAGICAGLPAPWRQGDVGCRNGRADFDGKVFHVEGEGASGDSTADRGHFVYVPLTGDAAITVRCHPQPSSQFTKMGISVRATLDSGSTAVSLVLNPDGGGSVEAPDWKARLLVRKSKGGGQISGGEATLDSIGTAGGAVVTYGRLTGYCWLRLERKGDEFDGSVSADGKQWISVGSVVLPLDKGLTPGNGPIAGIWVSSGMAGLSTTVEVDEVKVKKQ